MKKLLLNIGLTTALFSLSLSSSFLSAAAAGEAQVALIDDGTIILAYANQPDETVFIEGSIGSVDTNPSTWTTTDLSTGLGNDQLGTPLLFKNDNGDVIVIWQYVASGNYEIAAAVLPFGQTTWFVSRVSSNTFRGGGNNPQASLDENGNLIVTWLSYIESEMAFAVVGNNGTIVTTPSLDVTWSGAYRITPAP